MKVKNLNNSSIKTKSIIKSTFVKLIKEHGELNKITVSELVKKADINRSTFYNHYDSIYDVAEEFESEVIKVLFNSNQTFSSLNDIFSYIDNIFSYLKDNEDTYRLLLSSKEPLIFLEKLKKYISDKLFLVLKATPNFSNNKDLKFNINFFTDGITIQILRHFKDKTYYSLDEICAYSKKLFKLLFVI